MNGLRKEESEKKHRAAAFFDNLASPGYGLDWLFFVEMGKLLVEVADIPEGGQVLDIASGRGASLFPAAYRVGQAGRVVGIDIAEAMVQHTNAEIRD